MLKHVLLAGLLSLSVGSSLNAQSCGNDEKYRLPLPRITYVKEPLVTENEYRCGKT